MKREKIAKFQARLAGLVLGHGTSADRVASILENGLTGEYNYACVEEGWEMHGEDSVNLRFRADRVADRTYPDPEGQWGELTVDVPVSMKALADAHGLEAVLDDLERCLSGEGYLFDEHDDPTDPRNWNLVIVGPVGPEVFAEIDQNEEKI